MPGQREVLDRRRFLGRIGTIAWSTPVIWTLMSDTALAQCAGSGVACCAACSPTGAVGVTCTTGITLACCSGLTCRKAASGGAGQPCTCS